MKNKGQEIHLTVGNCYEMFFNNLNAVIRFKIVWADSYGTRRVDNCETGERFEFHTAKIQKEEYATLTQIACEGLCK